MLQLLPMQCELITRRNNPAMSDTMRDAKLLVPKLLLLAGAMCNDAKRCAAQAFGNCVHPDGGSAHILRLD